MNKLSFGLNGSYIYTNAKMPLATVTTGSQLEGAAPWIANFDLSHHFTRDERSFVNTLVLNYVSDKIYTIGTQGYQDIMERGTCHTRLRLAGPVEQISLPQPESSQPAESFP